MPLTDPQRAREKIREFLNHFERFERLTRELYGTNSQPHRDDLSQRLRAVESQINTLQPLIERIGSLLDAEESPTRFKRSVNHPHWATAHAATERLLGILDNEPLFGQILGPVGPTLSAQRLHKWVWKAAVNLWEDGHYQQAVLSAANAIEDQTKLKVDRRDLSGKKLYSQLFTCKDGDGRPLQFSEFERSSESWTSAHEGAHHYGMACTLRIRNIMVHSIDEVNEQEGLEYLAALSVLARWIDDAQVSSGSRA